MYANAHTHTHTHMHRYGAAESGNVLPGDQVISIDQVNCMYVITYVYTFDPVENFSEGSVCMYV